MDMMDMMKVKKELKKLQKKYPNCFFVVFHKDTLARDIFVRLSRMRLEPK